MRTRTAFVGDHGRDGLDAAEAWAETYARAVWSSSSWDGGWWPRWPWYLDRSLAPTPRTLELARLDAVEPWQRSEKVFRGAVAPRRAARLAVAPLDGTLRARLVAGPGDAVVSVYAGGRKVAGPGRRVTFTVCGHRGVGIRVTSTRGGTFAVAVS